MNSDLVYKKKYLKYKSKYTALQKEMNVQEGGLSFSAIKPTSIKSGIYLFIVSGAADYAKLLDPMGLPKEVYLRDSGVEISNTLGSGCYYAERKIDISGAIAGKLGFTKETPNLELKSCETGQLVSISGTQFTGATTNVTMVAQIASVIKQQIANLTHYFIVDYNSLKSNRISCLFPIQ